VIFWGDLHAVSPNYIISNRVTATQVRSAGCRTFVWCLGVCVHRELALLGLDSVVAPSPSLCCTNPFLLIGTTGGMRAVSHGGRDG